MIFVTKCTKILRGSKLTDTQTRYISKYLDKDKMSKAVRQRFLDFFINENNHNYIRSSPVVPYCDPSVTFVNAGMNQFKGILQGRQTALYRKVANSQKCVRVGGKHNDLNLVGTDGYHHTFFEMLGNWSFGDYFKQNACEMAWKLLTTVYKINPRSLYVTYFAGDENLGVKADLECKEIWRNIGVPEDRILPFGIKDNFWEMGLTGPCGPCTEIHVDHRGVANRAEFVNKGLHDLTEIWNIVFIQYNREIDGTVKLLPEKHVDTGMGFERLCAVMQGKLSNYDTDIFVPLFAGIRKICKGIPEYKGLFGENDWNSLNNSYRILTDHSRMVTSCLADGMVPEENQKLRRIIRKAFLIGGSSFKQDTGLLKELSNYVVESLGPVYVEMEKNIKHVHQIIDYEEDLYKSLRSISTAEWHRIIEDEPSLATLDVIEMPGLIHAYKDIKNNNIKEILPKYGFKLYDTYGLDEDHIIKLSQSLDLPFDVEKFRCELEKCRLQSKIASSMQIDTLPVKLKKIGLKPTDDSFKYKYIKKNNIYIFTDVPATVQWIIKGNDFVNTIDSNTDCSIIFDKTNLYCEAGGQANDKGYAVYNDGIFEINTLTNINGLILHRGHFISDKKLAIGETLIMKVDEEHKIKNMRNHTATHLLNAVLKQIKGATCQKSSKVTEKFLTLDIVTFGDKLTVKDVKKIEIEVNKIIKSATMVNVTEVNSQELLAFDNVTLVPGETYPESGIRLVEIISPYFVSREPCCGTHVFNTADIQDFRIVSCRSLGRSTTSIHAVTGPRAKLATNNGIKMVEDVTKLQKNVKDNIDKPEVLDMAVTALKHRLRYSTEDESIIPSIVRHECLEMLNDINKQIKDVTKGALKEFIEMEMKSVLQTKTLKTKDNKEFIVHYLRSSMILESVPLQKATKMCSNLPVLVISYSDNVVKARCCVPVNLRSEEFNAQKWLNEISTIFRSSAISPKGQDPSLVCNMKPKYINIQDWDTLLNKSLNFARDYAEKYL